MDARKFDIPVKTVRPAAIKGGIGVTVAFVPGSSYTVEGRDNSVVLSFPKAGGGGKSVVVAELKGKAEPSPPPISAQEMGTAGGAARWGFVTHSEESPRKYVGQRVSLDFKDADLANVFRIIAEVSNLNIITTDDVKGKVSVRLINVPWDQALDIVLKSKGLGVSQDGNVLRIAPLTSLRAEDKVSTPGRKWRSSRRPWR